MFFLFTAAYASICVGAYCALLEKELPIRQFSFVSLGVADNRIGLRFTQAFLSNC
jgi:hypothetical protein